MANNGDFILDNVDEFAARLARVAKADLNRTKDRMLRSGGLRFLEHAQDLTPVRTARLKGSLSMGTQDNFFKVNVTNVESYVRVGTNVPYAKHINDGFTQKAGQFVPGEWRSGTFHYRPGAHTGMVLTGKVIEGAHMFDKAADRMEEDMPRIMEFELRRLFSGLGGS